MKMGFKNMKHKQPNGPLTTAKLQSPVVGPSVPRLSGNPEPKQEDNLSSCLLNPEQHKENKLSKDYK